MNNQFEKWYKDYAKHNLPNKHLDETAISLHRDICKVSWDACKEEMLKIIDSHDLLVYGEEREMRKEIKNL